MLKFAFDHAIGQQMKSHRAGDLEEITGGKDQEEGELGIRHFGCLCRIWDLSRFSDR